jgi:2'-phosphotransferase
MRLRNRSRTPLRVAPPPPPNDPRAARNVVYVAALGPSRAPYVDGRSVSKLLSWILRHEALGMGLRVRADGYVQVSEMLELDVLKSRNITAIDICNMVNSQVKHRFGIEYIDSVLHIRAHQGHSIREVVDEQLLREITCAEELPILCHGTYTSAWARILYQGCYVMNRNHIHCVAFDLAADENQCRAVSGARGQFDVVVYIDVESAMIEGVQFYRSENGVILTRGHDGILPPHLLLGASVWNWDRQDWDYDEPTADGDFIARAVSL